MSRQAFPITLLSFRYVEAMHTNIVKIARPTANSEKEKKSVISVKEVDSKLG